MVFTEKVNQSRSIPSPFLQPWQPSNLTREAVTLPSVLYTSDEIYQLEQARIFGKAWCYVGNTSRLKEAGSYFTTTIAGQPLIVLRDRAGTLRAFLNVCPHRGAPLALESGQCSKLTCLYHAWTFDLEGNLRGAPEMDTAAGFDLAEHHLQSVKVDTWESFIFVNFDPDSQPLRVQLSDLSQKFERYHLNEWVEFHHADYWVDANWKLFYENTAESYHEPHVHRSVPKFYTGMQAEAKDYYYSQYVPHTGIDQESLSEVMSALPLENSFLENLNESELSGSSVLCLFPNFCWTLSAGFGTTYLIDPQAATRTRIQISWIAPAPVANLLEDKDLLVQSFESLLQEDLNLLPHIQQRVMSSGYRQGRLSPVREMGVHLFQQRVMQYLTQAEITQALQPASYKN
ncbi:MAG: aromatic ring-hydroxylating dioxygenase subunit alpha [Leptolyngbyaceae cyanobacterium bins.302]|nr:aromatic ring-hydroxylating dioxygenase subunit alpha [Leptolyngbyaceae cyanobacterium bins.302]